MDILLFFLQATSWANKRLPAKVFWAFTHQGVAPGVPGRNVSQDLAFRLVLDRESLAIGLIRGHLPKVHCVSPK